MLWVRCATMPTPWLERCIMLFEQTRREAMAWLHDAVRDGAATAVRLGDDIKGSNDEDALRLPQHPFWPAQFGPDRSKCVYNSARIPGSAVLRCCFRLGLSNGSDTYILGVHASSRSPRRHRHLRTIRRHRRGTRGPSSKAA